MMDRTKWNERPTEVYVRVLRKEGASERVLGAILMEKYQLRALPLIVIAKILSL